MAASLTLIHNQHDGAPEKDPMTTSYCFFYGKLTEEDPKRL